MHTKHKILIVDDELDILEFLTYNFEQEGFNISTAKDGIQAIKKAKETHPDLIILDVMMPNLNGIETCKQLREMPTFKDTLIVFLTARNEDIAEIAGFDAGADDYVSKPIRPKTLIARVKTLLKRSLKTNTKSLNLKIGELAIDLEKRMVIKNKIEITLPKKEFQLLVMLAQSPDKVFTRDEIYNEIWGNSIIVGDRTLDVHIRKLRKKIGDNFIRTSKGVGYSFNSKNT